MHAILYEFNQFRLKPAFADIVYAYLNLQFETNTKHRSSLLERLLFVNLYVRLNVSLVIFLRLLMQLQLQDNSRQPLCFLSSLEITQEKSGNCRLNYIIFL